jgi:hypothetical protein
MHYHLTTSSFWSNDVTLHISLTVQSNVRQLNILTNGTTALDVYSVVIPKYLFGSSLIGRRKILTPGVAQRKEIQLIRFRLHGNERLLLPPKCYDGYRAS